MLCLECWQEAAVQCVHQHMSVRLDLTDVSTHQAFRDDFYHATLAQQSHSLALTADLARAL